MLRSSRIKTSTLLRECGVAAFVALGLAYLPVSPAWAQLPSALSGQSGGKVLGGLGGSGGKVLGGLGGVGGGLPTVTQAGSANTAGVLQYCIKNNYLSGGVAGPAKDALLGKSPQSQSNSGFQAGSSGLLQTGNGKTFSLGSSSSGGIQSQATHKVCDMVLQHAKSLL